MEDALKHMVFQFGYRGVKNGKPMVWTGGLSALEEAFEVLGWDDPHYLPDADGYTCEIVGCMKEPTCGMPWGDLYLSICSDHHRDYILGRPRPLVKQWALDREARRDSKTGILQPA